MRTMVMTKGHFEIIADALKKAKPGVPKNNKTMAAFLTWRNCVTEIADNIRRYTRASGSYEPFDRDRFERACGMEE